MRLRVSEFAERSRRNSDHQACLTSLAADGPGDGNCTPLYDATRRRVGSLSRRSPAHGWRRREEQIDHLVKAIRQIVVKPVKTKRVLVGDAAREANDVRQFNK